TPHPNPPPQGGREQETVAGCLARGRGKRNPPRRAGHGAGGGRGRLGLVSGPRAADHLFDVFLVLDRVAPLWGRRRGPGLRGHTREGRRRGGRREEPVAELEVVPE